MKRIMTAVMMLVAGAMAAHAQPQQKSMVDEVKERGILRAGIKTDVPYLGFVQEDGTNAGFEIDLVRDLARRLGVKVELIPTQISTRVQMLEQGRLDLLMATVSHYRSRDEVVDFSVDYLYTPQTLLVKKSSGIRSVKDMAGKIMGAAQGSGSLKKFPIAQPNVKLQTYGSWPETFFALERGLIDAIATDNILLASLRSAAKNPDEYILLGRDGIYSGGYYGVALRQNDSRSRDQINFLLQDQFLDGTWQKAFDKWLGKDSPLKMTLEDFDNYQMRVWDK